MPADPLLSGGVRRRGYRVHVPAGYRPNRPAPAVLLFHGNGGTAADLDEGSGLSELADRRGFLAVYPQGLSVDAGKPFRASSGGVEPRSTHSSCASCAASHALPAVFSAAGLFFSALTARFRQAAYSRVWRTSPVSVTV